MKQQRINHRKQTPVRIVSEKQVDLPVHSKEELAVMNQPCRTVLYVEVGDAATPNVRFLVAELGRHYQDNRHGIHYIIPVRHGKIMPDIEFEQEFLQTIRNLCTVQDGTIVFRDDSKTVRVVRTQI